MVENQGSYEANLLRLLIGYFHVSLTEQVALIRYGKGFHTLTKDEQDKLQSDLVHGALQMARSADARSLTNLLQVVQPPTTFGRVN